MIELNRIYNMDVRVGLKDLPDASIDMCMTSPPYWALRSYGTEPQIWGGVESCQHKWGVAIVEKKSGGVGKTDVGNFSDDRIHYTARSNLCLLCGGWRGELGLEPTFDLYLQHLLRIFDEVKRVLKPTGTCFVNMGDTYGGTGAGQEKSPNSKGKFTDGQYFDQADARALKSEVTKNMSKCLLMLPYRFAIAMTERGWTLRNVLIWHKRNCMPSSVKDRFTVDFEPLFMFSKSRKYFFDINAIREKTGNEATEEEYKQADGRRHFHQADLEKGMLQYNPAFKSMTNPDGRAPRAVWEVNTQPFAADHFAKYPEELCRRPILAGCPEWVCNKCGKPREPIYEPSKEYAEILKGIKGLPPGNLEEGYQHHVNSRKYTGLSADYKKVGLSDCGCNAGFSAGVVLDPFAGVGTTLKVAKRLGRSYIGFEIKKEYCEIAEKYVAGAENWLLRAAKKNKPLNEFITEVGK